MMKTSQPQSAHPSYLQLDRAALGGGSNELRAHLAGCPECRAYLDGLTDAPPESGLFELRRRVEHQGRVNRRRWWAVLPAAAAVGLLLAGLRPGEPRRSGEQPYLGAKGFASVWIYVKRGASTQLWDGKEALLVGDKLRLKVDPGRFHHVQVYSLKNVAAPELLYEGDVRPEESFTVPDAWQLDAEPGAERIVVILSDGVVTPRWPDWLEGKAGAGVSVLPFELPKTPVTAADGGREP
jgi:hypothetical protein